MLIRVKTQLPRAASSKAFHQPGEKSGSRRRLLGLTLALLPVALMWVYTAVRGTNFDYVIYRGALLDAIHGGSVYDFFVAQPQYDTNMGFVYPPFASLLMWPLGLVPHTVGVVLLALGTVSVVGAALVGVFHTIDTHREAVGRPRLSLLTWAWLAFPIGISYSALSNMQNGQVSFIVAALVLLDLFVLPKRWRGVLVGLAGAIKLTPLILVPYYVVTRQWRPALNACSSFCLAAIVGAVFRWQDSLRYWLHLGNFNNSFGTLARVDNWSIYGALARFGVTRPALLVIWAGLSVLVIGLALWRARRHFRQGQELEAIVVMGVAAGLVTAATWPHHVLFGLVACALLAGQRPAVGVPVLLAFTVGGYVLPEFGVLVVLLLIGFLVLGLPGNPHSAKTTRRVPAPTSALVDDPAHS
jgi:alpha-1,2-mannosyltransferase